MGTVVAAMVEGLVAVVVEAVEAETAVVMVGALVEVWEMEDLAVDWEMEVERAAKEAMVGAKAEGDWVVVVTEVVMVAEEVEQHSIT